MSKFAWVTLATNDSYSLGALVVANSLKKVGTQYQLAVLITPGVTESMRAKLQIVFDVVEQVNVLDSKDAANLALLSRPELGITFTKLHCWRLTQFEKCVFLDADTLVLQNSDELFDREELSAAPDVGWPDCFNSGVFVYKPSLDTFAKLTEFAVQKGSFDGGDQGLLNLFFSDWASKDISRHLPFVYNTCSTACYSYLPAFKQFGQNVKILHFIGQQKPWLVSFDPSTKTVQSPEGYGHLTEFLQLWWSIFCNDIHPKLSSDMHLNDQRQRGGQRWYENPQFQYVPPSLSRFSHTDDNNAEISFFDPWETYYEELQQTSTKDTQYFDDTNSYGSAAPNDTWHLNVTADNNVGAVDQSRIQNWVQQQSCNDNNHNHNEQTHETHHFDVHHPPSEQHLSDLHANTQYSPAHSISPCVPSPAPSVTSDRSHKHESRPHSRASNSEHAPLHCTASDAHDGTASVCENVAAHLNSTNSNYADNTATMTSTITDNDTITITTAHDINVSTDCYSQESGLAGALAQLTLGSPRSAEQATYEESMRRQCWEAGTIDYLGKDSFDNIWKRITQTLETKPDEAPVKRDRTPTPQPEELPVDDKKEVQVLGKSLNEIEEESQQQQTISTVETRSSAETTVQTSVQQQQQQQQQSVFEQSSTTTSTSSATETTTKTESTSGGLIDVNQTIVIVPGHQKVEFDPITNSKIVTEKTTTGYQQTITTVTPEGNTRTQTKTFFDAVEIPGEEIVEEEETIEETETIVPGSTVTTVTTISGPANAVQQVVAQKQETSTTEASTENTETTVVTSEASTTEQQIIKSESNKSEIEINKDLVVELQPASTTVTRKVLGSEETKVETIVSDDGKTTIVRKIVTQPDEEIEIVEYEEQTTTEPGAITIVTTTKTIPTESTTTTSEHVEQTETVTTTTVAAETSQVSSEEKQQTTSVDVVDAAKNVTTTVTTASPQVGEQVVVETIVSADGTTTKTTTVKQSDEQIEIVEEQRIVEPAVESKTITITKTIPIDAIQTVDEAKKEVVTESITQSTTQTQDIQQSTEIRKSEDVVNQTKVEEIKSESVIEVVEAVKQDTDKVEVVSTVKTVTDSQVEVVKKDAAVVETKDDVVVDVTKDEVKKDIIVEESKVTVVEETKVESVKKDPAPAAIVEEVKKDVTVKETNVEEIQKIASVDETKVITTTKNDSKIVAVVAGTEIVQTTLADGQEIEVKSEVSEDGKTKLLTKTVRQPEEEIEVEDYIETHTVGPAKITTTTKSDNSQVVATTTNPGTEENTVKTDKTKTTTNKMASETLLIAADSDKAIGQHQQVAVTSDTTKLTGEATTKVDGDKVSTKVAASATKIKTVDQEESTVTGNSKKTSKITGTQSKTTTISTESSVSGGKKLESLASANVAAIADKQKTISSSDKSVTATDKAITNTEKTDKVLTATDKTVKTVKSDKAATEKSVKSTADTTEKTVVKTTDKADASTVAKKVSTADKSTTKTATDTEVKSVKVDSATSKVVAHQETTSSKTTKLIGGTTTTKLKSDTATEDSSTKTVKTGVKKAVGGEGVVKTTTKTTTGDKAKTTKVGTTGTKKTTTTTEVAEAESKKTTVVGTTTDKVTGEVTTEEIRKFEGGTEHIFTTVRADGTKKMSSRTVYDAVPAEGSDDEYEYEEYEEEYEEEVDEEVPVVVTKAVTKSAAKKAVDPDAPPKVKKLVDPNAPPKVKKVVDPDAPPKVKKDPSAVPKVKKTVKASTDSSTPASTPGSQVSLSDASTEKDTELAKKKLQSAVSSKKTVVSTSSVKTTSTTLTSSSDSSSPVPPPRKKEVKSVTGAAAK